MAENIYFDDFDCQNLKEIESSLPRSVKNDFKENKLQVIWLDLDGYEWFLYKKDIIVNENIDFYRKRWTITHEWWHFFDETEVNEICPYLTKYKQEKEADKYAYENLLPEESLKYEMEENWRSIDELQIIFWVPIDKLKNRIKEIYKWHKNYQQILLAIQ